MRVMKVRDSSPESALLSFSDLISTACTWGPSCCGVLAVPARPIPWEVTKRAGSLLPWCWAGRPQCPWLLSSDSSANSGLFLSGFGFYCAPQLTLAVFLYWVCIWWDYFFFFFFSYFVLFYCLFVCLLWFLLIVSLSPFHFSFRPFSSFLVL